MSINFAFLEVRYLTKDGLVQIIDNVTEIPDITSDPDITDDPDSSIKHHTQIRSKVHTLAPIHTLPPIHVEHTTRNLISNATTTQQSTVTPDKCGPNAHSIDKLLKIDNIEKVIADNVISLRLRIDPELVRSPSGCLQRYRT